MTRSLAPGEPSDLRRRGSRRGRGRRRGELADFAAYAGHRDPAARERLIRTYLPLAASIARRYVHGHADSVDDIKQVAALGLVKAVDRYDPARGTAFSSFAVPTIEGEIRRYFRDRTWAVRPPRDLQERALRIDRDRERLSSQLGRSPTARELAGHSGCSVEDVVDATHAMAARACDSLERPCSSDGDGAHTLADRFGAEDPGYRAADARITLEALMTALSDRERTVVVLYTRDGLTQSQIGERIGCSQMHVSRIYRRAMAKLVARAEAQPPPPVTSG